MVRFWSVISMERAIAVQLLLENEWIESAARVVLYVSRANAQYVAFSILSRIIYSNLPKFSTFILSRVERELRLLIV